MIRLNELIEELKPKKVIICNKSIYNVNGAVKSFGYNAMEQKLLINLF